MRKLNEICLWYRFRRWEVWVVIILLEHFVRCIPSPSHLAIYLAIILICLSSQVMTVKIVIGVALPEQEKWIGKAKEVLEYREVCPNLHRFRGQ